MRALLPLIAWLWVGLLWSGAALAAPPTDLTVAAPDNDGGLNLQLEWSPAADDGAGTTGYLVLRADSPDGPWADIAQLPAGSDAYNDKVTTDLHDDPPQAAYHYRVLSMEADTPPFLSTAEDPDDRAHERAEWLEDRLAELDGTAVVEGRPNASLFNTSPGYLMLLALIVAMGALMALFTRQAQQGGEMFIRRIPGIDAIEEGIGRATEMGRPVLYVPGIDELQDIQTIASMLILGQVSKTVAEYQSDIIVTCCIPIVREVADEVVRAGFYQAGYPDAYSPTAVRFISSEQFAFCAGTNGIILREKPATNIYLGRFFAESLILAETGFVNRSIQIAGTAEATQLPFFIAACDYTLIGEELFAVSAYLSKDPRLVSSLKASDWIKVFVVGCLLVGTAMASFGVDWMVTLYTITGG